MKTRQEYEDIVAQPGEFKGKPIWTPYFYDLMMDGEGEIIGNTTVFSIEKEDIALFPELKDYTYTRLSTSDDGSCFCFYARKKF